MAKTDKIPDPAQMWREWVDQAERQWNSVLTDFMGTEQFGEASGKMMEAFLGVQASMNDATQRYFSALNLPTRTDILSLGERLSAIERSLDEVKAGLNALQPTTGRKSSEGKSVDRPRPRRTKKAPKKKKSVARKAVTKKASARKGAAKKA